MGPAEDDVDIAVDAGLLLLLGSGMVRDVVVFDDCGGGVAPATESDCIFNANDDECCCLCRC